MHKSETTIKFVLSLLRAITSAIGKTLDLVMNRRLIEPFENRARAIVEIVRAKSPVAKEPDW